MLPSPPPKNAQEPGWRDEYPLGPRSREEKQFRLARREVIFFILVGAFFFVLLFWSETRTNPAFLRTEYAGEWIRYPAVSETLKYPSMEVVAQYRKRFEEDAPPDVVRIRGLGDVHGTVDGEEALLGAYGYRTDRLASRDGKTLQFTVRNRNGHAALLVDGRTAEVSSGSDWEASVDGESWMPVETLTGPPSPPARVQGLPTAGEAFVRLLPWFALAFVVAAFAHVALQRDPARLRHWLRPRLVLGTVCGTFILLLLYNLARYPRPTGYDVDAHIDYVRFIVEQGALPFADDGWQMFQAPLFYLLGVLIFAPVRAFADIETAGIALRVLPMLCGLAQIPLAYWAARCVFPERRGLQALAAVLAAFLPMNVYMAHGISNEPLAGFLGAGVAAMGIWLMSRPAVAWRVRDGALLGLLLGAAVLTKVSAVLLVPPLMLALGYHAAVSGIGRAGITGEPPVPRRWAWLRPVTRVVVPMAMVCAGVAAWWYVRNWIALGSPFVGGWEDERGIDWWQDPGYRNAAQFLVFGRALQQPIYASFASVWDALYSTFWLDGQLAHVTPEGQPLWNLTWLIASAWTAAPLMIAMFVGVGVALARFWRGDAAALFCVVAPAVYVMAIVYLFLQVPIYSTAKASYMLAVTPCLVMLMLYGLAVLPRARVVQAGVVGVIAVWVAGVLGSYLIY